MSKTDFSKIKGQTPISIIVHGGNYLGFLLSKTLLEQGSQVIIIDKYTSKSKEYFSELKKTGKVSFIDFKGLKNFYEKISRIDYLFYLFGETIESVSNVDSKDFLSESDYLSTSLTAAHKYKAKISLITSLRLNRELSNRVNNEQTGKSNPYSPLELQRYTENFVAEFVDKTKANVRILRLGTLVGKGIHTITDDTLHNLLINATQKPQIEICGEGLDLHHIIHESDAVYGILKLTFDDSTKGEVISLSNKNEYTTLSLAYKLLELDVEAKAIRFIEKEDSCSMLHDLYVPAPNASQFSWRQRISLEEAVIEQIQAYYERSDKSWTFKKEHNRNKRMAEEKLSSVSKTKFGSFVHGILDPIKNILSPQKFFGEFNYTRLLKSVFLLVISFFAIYYLIAPVIGLSLGTYLIYNQSKNLSSSLSALEFESIENETTSISENLVRVENSLGRLHWAFKLTNNMETYNNSNQIIIGTKYAIDSVQDLSIGLRPLGNYLKEFEPAIGFGNTIPTTTREYRQYLSAMDENQYYIKEGIYKITLAHNLIESVNTKRLPRFMQDFVLQYKDLITETTETVKPLEKYVQFLPDILGVEQRKRYLILLQNEGEIRSTGGWISSYAIIAIEGGQIRELFVDDIYNAEGTLKVQGHNYRTPTSMIKALDNTPYTFSLVNWDPNLDSVLLSSEQFIYDLGKGNSLDGVITINTAFLQKLLDHWGGIEVPGESEIITSSNLYPKIFEMHAEFTPGSTRKSTFLANLANETVTKLLSSKFEDYKDIGDILNSSLDEKHIQATFKNSIAKSYFNENNWDGNLDSKYQSAPINIDWNWGANKANLYIRKNHTLEIDIKDERVIDYTYQIAIQNDSSKDTYPEGNYINYVRIFLPTNATVTGIRGLEDNKYDLYNEGGYKIVGGWFNVPIKENRVMEVSYRITKEDNTSYFPITRTDSHYEFDIYIYKQPGSKKDAYNLLLNYPSSWTVENNSNLSNIGNQLNRRFELASDQSFTITWQR
jgi:nucleoside-diphosphate-sugar epimerase